MKVPKWECKTVEEQSAFAHFVMRKLDESDEAAAISLTNAPIPEGLMEQMEFEAGKSRLVRLAKERGIEIKPPTRPRGRPKRDTSALDCAIRDVERMRDIFQQYWGKQNRYSRPTRTVIVAEYWGLSKNETSALERHFNKMKKSAE